MIFVYIKRPTCFKTLLSCQGWGKTGNFSGQETIGHLAQRGPSGVTLSWEDSPFLPLTQPQTPHAYTHQVKHSLAWVPPSWLMFSRSGEHMNVIFTSSSVTHGSDSVDRGGGWACAPQRSFKYDPETHLWRGSLHLSQPGQSASPSGILWHYTLHILLSEG